MLQRGISSKKCCNAAIFSVVGKFPSPSAVCRVQQIEKKTNQDNRAADQHHRGGALSDPDPDPNRSEDGFEKYDQADIRSMRVA